MIRIIEKGTLKTKKCSVCGCLFSYDDSDVKCISSSYSKDGCLINRRTYKEIIFCPQCDSEVVLVFEEK